MHVRDMHLLHSRKICIVRNSALQRDDEVFDDRLALNSTSSAPASTQENICLPGQIPAF